jgi:hypothetical protein
MESIPIIGIKSNGSIATLNSMAPAVQAIVTCGANLAAISDPIAENIFGNAGYAIKGIDSAVPYLNIANERVHGRGVETGEDSFDTINSIAACATFYWARGLNDYENRHYAKNDGYWRIAA